MAICLKKKIRKYVEITKEGAKGFDIYIKEGNVLETINREVMANVVDKKEIKKNAVKILCERFYDNRTFGALLIHKKSKDEEELSDKSKKDKKNGKVEEADGKAINLGALTGPVQFSYAESINEIKVDVDCITRDCVTNEKDTEKERTMGRKPRINYGLYKFNVYITPYFARKTGFDSVD